MSVKRLTPKKCPHCGAENTLYLAEQGDVTCWLCGQSTPQVSVPIIETPKPDVRPKREQYPVTYGKLFHGELDQWAESAYHSGLAYVEQDKIDDAIKAFLRALDSERDFVDAHLWLARLYDDPEKKRNHYGEVLALMPNHLESIRELMVIKGELTRAEADNSQDTPLQASTRQAELPVQAEAVTLECPVCGGGIRTLADGRSECKHCGYISTTPKDTGYGMRMLTMEILKRRGQAIQWEVGTRYLKCDACGAETLLSQVLSSTCAFCGSRRVIESDVLHSFVQPSGVVPFAISESTARFALDKALNRPMEKVMGWFGNNKVSDVRVTSAYLPFWLFDMTLLVSRTTQEKGSGLYEDRRHFQPYRNEQIPSSAFDEPICGVQSPPKRMTDRLERFDLEDVLAYQPSLLADHTAQLYTLDFEKASLVARQRVSERVRQDFGHGNTGNATVNVQSLVQTMQFRLVLMPLWIATLRETDGDVRLAVIHGQSGQTVLGVSERK
jgi:Zn finger protein HypA/HybF involved in hydrogenase expression